RDVRELPLESNGRAHGPQAVVLTLDRAIDWTAFGIWLTMLLHARGAEILRIKGLLDVGGAGPLLVNCVQHAVYPPAHLDSWPDEDHRSRLVFIGHGVDRDSLETSLRAFDRAAAQ
ncbi:MAG: GTP-binding protein, partial [Gaiellaceae bacterium]